MAGALEDCKKAVELHAKADTTAASYDQGLIDFMNGDYTKAVASWQTASEKEPSYKRELQPWIDKAKAKLAAAK